MSGLGYTYFYVCAAISLLGALFTVTAKNPIRGAMGLMAMIVAVAGIFLALHAEFLAIIQLIVYAGAIVVLFLFVIMLLGPSASTPQDQRGRITRAAGGGLFALASLFAMYLVIHPAWKQAVRLERVPEEYGTVDAIGRVLFHDAVIPFELSSALLMVAIVGAVAVARGRHKSDIIGAPPPEAKEKEAKS
ncbi:NADH-quinone oxidoreductase subunit J [soil metagenome]